MRSLEEQNKIIELYIAGNNQCQIARLTGMPRGTVKDYIDRYKTGTPLKLGKEVTSSILEDLHNPTQEDKDIYQKYVYLLGVYFGDGSLVKIKNKKDLYSFRIHQDAKYPNIINEMKSAVETIMPENKIWITNKFYKEKLSSVDITCWSKLFIKLLPTAQPGKKHSYSIKLEPWQQKLVDRYPKLFLRGLIQTDGCRYKQTNTKNNCYYSFTQKSDDILNLFLQTCEQLHIKVKHYLHKSGSLNNAGEENTAWIAVIRDQNDVAFMDTFIGIKS